MGATRGAVAIAEVPPTQAASWIEPRLAPLVSASTEELRGRFPDPLSEGRRLLDVECRVGERC